MINVQEYLLQNNIDVGAYALVTYNNTTEAVYFAKHNLNGEDWFLESPCILFRMTEIDKPIDIFAKEWASFLYNEDDVDDCIDKYVKPMIIDNVLYEIENFQCSPFLPKYIDEINLISQRECLKYLLKLTE